MSISIAGGSSFGDTAAAGAAAAMNSALQTQVQASQSAVVAALFGSLGLGTNTNTTA